jgi:predicted RNA binding protein YcfA (HicA-like mRNA interferase family)
MSRLPRVTGIQTIRALQRAGFVEIRRRGSHVYLRRPARDEIRPDGTIQTIAASALVTVPDHRGETLRAGTLASILNQAGLSADEFRDLL